MKIKMSEIISAVGPLGSLKGLGLITVLKAKQNGKALKPVQDVLNEFEAARLETVKKYDVLDKKQSEVPPEKWAQFEAEYQELLDEEHEFPTLPISIPGNATGLNTEEIEKLETLNFITVKE